MARFICDEGEDTSEIWAFFFRALVCLCGDLSSKRSVVEYENPP